MTISIDAMIDWYEKHKPDAGRRIEVNMTPAALCKTIGVGQQPFTDEKGARKLRWPREVLYRGRTLVAKK